MDSIKIICEVCHGDITDSQVPDNCTGECGVGVRMDPRQELNFNDDVVTSYDNEVQPPVDFDQAAEDELLTGGPSLDDIYDMDEFLNDIDEDDIH